MSLPELAAPRRNDTPARRAARWLATLALLLTPALAGCEGGFKPLYGSAGIGLQANEKMARVQITPIPSRTGVLVRNELIFDTVGGGTPPPPLYKLDINLRTSATSTLVQRDGTTLGQIISVEANFTLTRLSDKQVVFKGTSFGRASYERFTSIYANVRASEEAESRAARTVATDIRARLGAFFGSQT